MGGYVNRTKIAQLYADAESLGGQTVTVAGWVKSVRDMKNFGFVTLNDGSCFRDLQVVMNRAALDNYDEIAHQNVSAALICTGTVKLTPDAPQPFELSATSIEVEGTSACAPRGENGFGVDPVFFVPDKRKTFAQLSAEEKAEISHRGKALRAFTETLKNYLAEHQ